VHHRQVAARLAELPDLPNARPSTAAERAALQARRLGLPLLPTTTIGSLAQTPEIRAARRRLGDGELTDEEYERFLAAEIHHAIDRQEQLGLDVLVHGEPERNDMVQYFAERLTGFAVTEAGWVQSYGSRCVRRPILFGDVSRPEPITVAWWRYAQGLTRRPVKAILTGPVTMMQWSFVRDDAPPRRSPNSWRWPSPTRPWIWSARVPRSSRSMRPPCARACRCAAPNGPATCAGRSTASA
jgi:5-methyltetrahydropteroyltriglutamate--homocysteine methyltransferase